MLTANQSIAKMVVCRNQALTWRQACWFMLVVLGFHLAFMVFAGLRGWWPLLGFVGISYLLLLGGMVAVLNDGRCKEVITVTEDRIVVEFGKRHPESRMELDRYWARVERRQEDGRHLLILHSRGAEIEVGRPLSDPERESLARRLRSMVGPKASVGTWVQGRETEINAIS